MSRKPEPCRLRPTDVAVAAPPVAPMKLYGISFPGAERRGVVVVCSDTCRAEYLKKHPKAKALRLSVAPVDRLCAQCRGPLQ